MKLRFFLITLILLLPMTLFADEALPEETEEVAVPPEKTALFFTLGPVGMLNTDTLSAPSPIQFAAGFGATIPVNSWFAFSPSISLFTNYWLWRNNASGGRAYPAEVENRTGLAPSALVELPAVFYAKSGNSTFSFGLGVTIFARYAFLADSVPQAEAGDIKKMNSWFYDALRFLYPSAHFAYDLATESGMKAGIVLRAYLPLASLMEDRGLDAGIASIAFRITLRSFSEKTEEPAL